MFDLTVLDRLYFQHDFFLEIGDLEKAEVLAEEIEKIQDYLRSIVNYVE